MGQALTFASIRLQSLRELRNPAELSSGISDAVDLMDQLLQQARKISLDLHPPLLDHLGLAAALRWYFDQQSQRMDFNVEFSIDPNVPRVDREVETSCFRVAQEALTNILRHSGSTEVFVELSVVPTGLQLSVRDQGIGFDVSAAMERAQNGGSLGLIGMRERVSLVGGTLEIKSTPGTGTNVVALFPTTPMPLNVDAPA